MGIAIIIPNSNFSGHGLGKVTLTSEIPLVSMSITGETNVVGNKANYKALLYPGNTSERDVTWSVTTGGTYASINSVTGLLTVDESANNSTVIIKAESVDNSDIYATLELTVTYIAGTYGEDLSQNLTWTNGYVDMQYVIQPSSVSRYSSPVQVQAGDIIFAKVKGTGFRPIIECDSSGNNMQYGVAAQGWNYLSTTATYAYAYHVANNGYVRFCSKEGDDLAFWRAQKSADIIPTLQSGYIDTSGTIQSSSVTSHSTPIAVEAGDIIVLKTAGSGLCLMALTNAAGTSYTPILQCPDPNKDQGTAYYNIYYGALKLNGLNAQPNTPTLGVWSSYQGVTSFAATPCTYAMSVEQSGYISVCVKPGLPYSLSIYKIG